jgi:hypothetical protein
MNKDKNKNKLGNKEIHNIWEYVNQYRRNHPYTKNYLKDSPNDIKINKIKD